MPLFWLNAERLGLYFLAVLALLLIAVCSRDRASSRPYATRRRPTQATPATPPPPQSSGRRKPDWVRREVARLAALNPHGSCRTIAATFRALFLGIESVSKSWVATFLRDEKYRIEVERQTIRRRKPPALPRNRIWALDLTSVPIDNGTSLALGILDHGTRACIALRRLASKHSLVVLSELIVATRRLGLPKQIRTDNEAVFTSRLFRWGLFLLGVRHQRIEKLAPWQNGRIERFFGSFKHRWRLYRQLADQQVQDLQAELDTFRGWYNHVRPHQHLEGRVPADVWSGAETRPARPHAFVSEWEEVLTGFHFR